MPSERILVVEDEVAWVELLKLWFAGAGYTNAEYAMTGREAVEMAVQRPPDIILLDLVLPDQSGMEVCQKLRALPTLSRVPVILHTGHKREKVLGLQNGADYFVDKTEKPHELLATLEAAIRRRQKEEGVLQKGDLRLHSHSRDVYWKADRVATLTPKMFSLLHILVERSPQPVSRQDLYRMVEGVENPGLSRALDVMLNRLRKALPGDISGRIGNVKNFGYVFLDTQSPS